MTERHLNLVAPLAQKVTAMRITETAGYRQNVSGAVTPLIGANLRQGDVDSAIEHRTQPTPIMPGIRISETAIRTTTTRTTRCAPVLSADPSGSHHAEFSFAELCQAYFDCRKNKRNTATALAFESNLEHNLRGLYDELISQRYVPGRSICFVITRPKPREVWAAFFRDRIVHHLFYNRVAPRFYASFIADSCACIPGRGTLYAATRLEAKIRSITQNWSQPAHYLKCDLANFFVAIDKDIVYAQLLRKINEPYWQWLAAVILYHDPRLDFEYRGPIDSLALVPAHKRLTSHGSRFGLPIGNLSSQFFANVYLNDLDQYIKHQVGARHYIRYVDDFILLHQSPQWLHAAHMKIAAYLPAQLNANLNESKTILQPVDRGVDFVGQVIKPWHRHTRKRTGNEALSRVISTPPEDLFEVANSYFGLFRQAGKSHKSRCKLANALRRRGHTINKAITQTYRKSI